MNYDYDMYDIVDRRSERKERRERYIKNLNRSSEHDSQRGRKWNKTKRHNKMEKF